jgi:eukaryotic-like serine/threonine-protein kinase
MDRERWQQVDRISASALRRQTDERAAFLDAECAGDEELRRDVDSIIAHGRAGDFMGRSAAGEVAGLVVRSAALRAGETVDAYRILKRLGAGGMGEIYLARDLRLDRQVALKLLPTHFTEDKEHARRFRREALAASALNHPNILTVYQVGEWNGMNYIATEYVEGVTLRARMRGKRMSLSDAVDMALQITGALSAAHAAGIVHRDVKPENLMVRPDGLVKLLDFGIAKYIERSSVRDFNRQLWVRTGTGIAIGTTAYMSPEQARGEKIDARADLWSLGIILYEMVARRPPFSAKTSTDRVALILERDPEPLSKRHRGVPAELDRIVGRCLAKNKEDRYASASDLAEDLGRLRATLGETRRFRFVLPAPARGLRLARSHMIIGAVLFLVISLAGAALFNYLRPATSIRSVDSLAVLPLINDGGSADSEYLSDGVTEGLINSLSQLPSLRVMSRNSVFRYKGQEVDPLTVANALNVNAVLTGRVAQRGDDLVVSMELVDARDSSHLWGGRYSRKVNDLVALQNEITRDVSRTLRARLSGREERKVAKGFTANAEAYQFYLRGRYHLLKNTRSEIETSISHFRHAIEIDESYALAYVGLAEAYRVLGLSGESPATEALPQTKAAAQKAVEIDDGLAEAHTALGLIKYLYDWDFAEAESQFKRALELDPNSADTHQAYATLLSYTGRHAEALAEIKIARELDPLNVRAGALEGSILINAGQPDEALARLQKTLELEPNYWFARQYVASAYIEKGMFAEAVTEAYKAKELSGASTRPAGFRGYALAKAGRRAEARSELEALLRLSKERYVSRYNIAIIYNGLGDRDEALGWLQRGYLEREPRMVFLRVEPKWNNLRGDPRFQDLLRRIGFTH